MAKTNVEKLSAIQEKIAQYKNQEKLLLQKQKEEVRKARTHRLIERGALLESLMGVADDITNEKIKEVLAIALHSDAARKALFSLREQVTAASSGTKEASAEGEA